MTAHLVSPRVFAFSKRSGAGEGEEVSRWRTGELEDEGESGGEQQPHFLGRSGIGSPEGNRRQQERDGLRGAQGGTTEGTQLLTAQPPGAQEAGELAQGSQRLGEVKA